MERKFKVDSPETAKVKLYAMKQLRSDLIGVANIERFKDAPLMMSPHGVMPDAKSVIVMAVHHPDAAIERGGLPHPQEQGPYCVQYYMNTRLDDISYRMSNFLEKLGYRAVPIVSSNIWRYKGYKGLSEQFAPDVSHMHAAVAAGLAEFGYNGLAITPEYGARVRYVTVITDAELTPSPLIEPGSICDNCMACRKHCMSGALSKEIDGWNIVKIEDKEYKYAKKNLWRCAWGEHFDLDLDLPIPDKVDEAVIMDAVVKYGRRGGEMGSCLRYCLPKNLRYNDKPYTNTFRRKRHFIPNAEIKDFHRGLFENIRAAAADWAMDGVIVSSAEDMTKYGIDINAILPGAKRAVSLICSQPWIKMAIEGQDSGSSEKLDIAEDITRFAKVSTSKAGAEKLSVRKAIEKVKGGQGWEGNVGFAMIQAGYDMVRMLENAGYTSCQLIGVPDDKLKEVFGKENGGVELMVNTWLTEAELPLTDIKLPSQKYAPAGKRELTRRLKFEAEQFECDLFGVAPASRIDAIVPSLRKAYDGEEEFYAYNKAKTIYVPYEPEIEIIKRKVLSTIDYLEDAKSVIVIGMRMPKATVDITTRTPAEAAGPYVFAQYEAFFRLRLQAHAIAGKLRQAGYKAIYTTDLNSTGSVAWNPRGFYPDSFCNVFAAAAAGLGAVSTCGSIVTPEFGSNVRFMAIVTDAELDYNKVLSGQDVGLKCSNCNGTCKSACKTSAFEAKPVTVKLDKEEFSFSRIDINRCNWAKRYGLVGSEGGFFTGWDLDLPYPEKLTKENLDKALRSIPMIQKVRPCNYEQCVLACPHSRNQSGPCKG